MDRMTWKIKFYDGVLQSVLGMPPGIQARKRQNEVTLHDS
jgi:hypothetical protein